jgi:excisionase family DNA binding protein
VRYLTVKEAARHLRVHANTIYKLIADGDLDAVRVGRSLRIPADVFTSYIRENTSGS